MQKSYILLNYKKETDYVFVLWTRKFKEKNTGMPKLIYILVRITKIVIIDDV